MPGPPYDPECKAALDKLPRLPPLSLETLPAFRANSTVGVEALPKDPSISHTERSIPGPDGQPLLMSIVRVAAAAADPPLATGADGAKAKPKPAVYDIFGGGMITGSRFRAIPALIKFAKECDAVIFSIGYRLAPEHPDPALVEDCYAGLVWIASHADELGIDPARILLKGASSGAGVAAGVALLARDRKGPAVMAQCLQCPMLDDRLESVANRQYAEGQPWTSRSSRFAWDCLLGERRGGDDVSIYAAPARAKDLAGLPPAFIDVGSAEVMRDEAVAYAGKLWEAGVQAELHVWPGAFHGFELFASDSTLAKTAKATREAWIVKTLTS